MRTSDLSKPAIAITGATGILGSAVMAEAVRRGYRPIAIVRDSAPEQARIRIRSVLGVYGMREAAEDVCIVQGDIRRLWLGMEPRIAAGLLGCARAFVHCAALTGFDPSDAPSLRETNVSGTRSLVELLTDRNVPLYHVSTAYVAGVRAGVAYERELATGHESRNAYERSKWEAESSVREAYASGRIRGAIFRPGVVTGSTADGAITAFHHIYGFLRLVHLARSRSSSRARVVRLDGAAGTLCNLVPVDWAAQAMWHIIENEGQSQKTYHLVDPSGTTMGDLFAWANDVLAEFDVRFELVSHLDDAGSAFENMARSALGHYRPYAFRQPQFDFQNTLRAIDGALTLPRIDRTYFDTLFQYACARRWKGILEPPSATHPFAVPSPGEREAAALPA